jgi:hypothetical protein
MITGSVGCDRWIASNSAMPSMPGIFRSVTTTFGSRTASVGQRGSPRLGGVNRVARGRQAKADQLQQIGIVVDQQHVGRRMGIVHVRSWACVPAKQASLQALSCVELLLQIVGARFLLAHDALALASWAKDGSDHPRRTVALLSSGSSVASARPRRRRLRKALQHRQRSGPRRTSARKACVAAASSRFCSSGPASASFCRSDRTASASSASSLIFGGSGGATHDRRRRLRLHRLDDDDRRRLDRTRVDLRCGRRHGRAGGERTRDRAAGRCIACASRRTTRALARALSTTPFTVTFLRCGPFPGAASTAYASTGCNGSRT